VTCLVFITSSWPSSSSGTKTTATARWALLFIVRAFNNTITVAVWTGFHVRLMGMLPHPRDYIRWCFADPAVADAFAKESATSLMDSALH
jgi:hypothetical protein